MTEIIFEPTATSKLRRGHIARDVTTGIVGMVSSISITIDGSVLISLQPAAALPSDKAPDLRWIDEQACEHVNEGEVARFDYRENIGGWKFGDAVADKVSGACGIITEFQLCRNGCVLACITPETDWSDSSPQPTWVSVTRLQTTDELDAVEVTPDKQSGSCDVRPGSGRKI